MDKRPKTFVSSALSALVLVLLVYAARPAMANTSEPFTEMSDQLERAKSSIMRELTNLDLIVEHNRGTRNSAHAIAKRLIDIRLVLIISGLLISGLLMGILLQLRKISNRLSPSLNNNLGSARPEDVPDAQEEETEVSSIRIMIISLIIFFVIMIAVIYVGLKISS